MTRSPFAAPLLFMALSGCTNGSPLNPRDAADANDTGKAIDGKNASERSILRRLPALASGRSERVGDVTVVAETPYASASGRTCRQLALASERDRRTSHRLACTGGGAWFFVPDVFAAGVEAE